MATKEKWDEWVYEFTVLATERNIALDKVDFPKLKESAFEAGLTPAEAISSNVPQGTSRLSAPAIIPPVPDSVAGEDRAGGSAAIWIIAVCCVIIVVILGVGYVKRENDKRDALEGLEKVRRELDRL